MILSRTKLTIEVHYDAPARDCRRVLRILPLQRPGQRIVREEWRCRPLPALTKELPDSWGNRRLLLYHSAIPAHLQLELLLEVQVQPGPLPAACGVPEAGVGVFLLPSRLADLSPEVKARAGQLKSGHSGTALMGAIGAYCHGRLRYNAEPRPRALPAGAILNEGQGSCQDFAHLMIALCRAAGLPARYVAGYNPTEGLMHAWVEVLAGEQWHSFDPVHNRPPSPGTVAVALGRDQRDVRTISGSFRGHGAGLSLHCQTRAEPMAHSSG